MTTSDLKSRFNIVIKQNLRTVYNDEEKKTNDAMILASASCIWEPYNNSCTEIPSKHLSISLNASRRNFLAQFSKPTNHPDTDTMNVDQQYHISQSVHRRWLFLGDSTMIRLDRKSVV